MSPIHISTLLGTSLTLIKATPKVRVWEKDYIKFCVLFFVDRLVLTEHKKCLFLADISITRTYYSWSLDSILDRVIGVIFGIKTSLEFNMEISV